MDGDNSSDATGLGESFLSSASNQFVTVEGQVDDEDAGLEHGDSGDNEPLKEQDRFLPIANVARRMKRSIPSSGKIAKDAKECVQECVSEFISFITSEASERCHQEKRKTINGEDILFAMSTLGFDNYVEPLKVYLQKYRESTKGDKVNSAADSLMDDIAGEESFGLATNILTTDGQQSVIYAPAYQPTVGQTINFGTQ